LKAVSDRSFLQPWRFHAQALLWMLVGSGLIFFCLYLMNRFAEPLKAEKATQSTTFEVQRQERPKPKRVVKRKPQKAPPKITPPPSLTMGSDIAGLDFGLPAFSLDDFSQQDHGDLLGNTENVVMTSDLVDSPPRPLTRAEIHYPRRAKAREIEGYVVMSILIDTSGRVTRAKVIEADPAGVFENEALRNIEKWIFEPASYDGQPVKTWANQTIRFQLG
jgi:protein TonB